MTRELSEKAQEIKASLGELQTEDLVELSAIIKIEVENRDRIKKKEVIDLLNKEAEKHGLHVTVTSIDSIGKRKTGVKAGFKAKAKYEDKTTGQTWAGRGITPKWLKARLAEGKKLDDFLTDEFKAGKAGKAEETAETADTNA